MKLIAAIILFLVLLCAILSISGSTYNCNAAIDKMKELATAVKDGTMSPMDALGQIRTKLAEVWTNFKGLAPVVVALGYLSGNKKAAEEIEQMFTKPVEEVKTETVPNDLMDGTYTVSEIKSYLKKPVLKTVFDEIVHH